MIEQKIFFNSFPQNLTKLNIIHQYSRFTDRRPSIAGQVVKDKRNSMKKPVLENGTVAWITELPSKTKQKNNTIHNWEKMTPDDGSKNVNGKSAVSSKLVEKKEKSLSSKSVSWSNGGWRVKDPLCIKIGYSKPASRVGSAGAESREGYPTVADSVWVFLGTVILDSDWLLADEVLGFFCSRFWLAADKNLVLS